MYRITVRAVDEAVRYASKDHFVVVAAHFPYYSPNIQGRYEILKSALYLNTCFMPYRPEGLIGK